MHITLAYAHPAHQRVYELELPDGATVEAAIVASGVLADRPEIDLKLNRVGIFGRKADLWAAVQDGDRIEIYRALQIDPKEARRLRAQARGRK